MWGFVFTILDHIYPIFIKLKNIVPNSNVLKKDYLNNAMWAIADDMRARKDASEFETHLDA